MTTKKFQMYGIPNCNTVKKAMNFFNDAGIEFEFINFKKTPPSKELLKKWKTQLGDYPVNSKGPTFRKIREHFEVANAAQKYQLLVDHSSAIKRPIIECNGKLSSIGFSEEDFSQLYS